MSFTLTTLKSTIQDYTENTETTFVNDLDTIIKQAESRINAAVQLPAFKRNVLSETTINNPYVGIPTDFLYPYSLAVINSEDEHEYLLNKDVNFIREAYPKQASNKNIPKFYAQFSNSHFILAPTPDAVYELEMHYFHLPASITASASGGLSWLGTNAPDTLLYGCLVEAYTFMKGEPDIIANYEQRFKESLSLLQLENDGRNRKDAYRRGQTRIQEQ